MTTNAVIVILCLMLVVIISPVIADSEVNVSVDFSGNSTYQIFYLVDGVTDACPNSESAVLYENGTAAGCYNGTTLIEDQSYSITGSGVTDTGKEVTRTVSAWFKRTERAIKGLSSEFDLWIALGLMIFTAALGTQTTAAPVSIVVCFEGWIFYGLNMFSRIDAESPMGGTVVPAILTVMTFTAILWNFVEYRRRGK